MLANLQNYLEIKHDCLLIYVNRVISQGAEVSDPSAPLCSKRRMMPPNGGTAAEHNRVDQGDRSLIFYFD